MYRVRQVCACTLHSSIMSRDYTEFIRPGMEITVDYDNDHIVSANDIRGGCMTAASCRCGLPICVSNIFKRLQGSNLLWNDYFFLADPRICSLNDCLMVNMTVVAKANAIYMKTAECLAGPYPNTHPCSQSTMQEVMQQLGAVFKVEDIVDECQTRQQVFTQRFTACHPAYSR